MYVLVISLNQIFKDSIDNAMKGVDFVFHAAALKQVPSCEFFPLEAVKTNILGTNNVLNAAEHFNIDKAVILSTDKAAYPINAMGMSKALMEKIMVARSRLQTNNDTVFCVTRYGNVMASRGSVIPLFISQIKNDAENIFKNTIKNYQKFIKDNFEYVGNNFAYEARSIHYNGKKKSIKSI